MRDGDRRQPIEQRLLARELGDQHPADEEEVNVEPLQRASRCILPG
jgi:hypothetical protein